MGRFSEEMGRFNISLFFHPCSRKCQGSFKLGCLHRPILCPPVPQSSLGHSEPRCAQGRARIPWLHLQFLPRPGCSCTLHTIFLHVKKKLFSLLLFSHSHSTVGPVELVSGSASSIPTIPGRLDNVMAEMQKSSSGVSDEDRETNANRDTMVVESREKSRLEVEKVKLEVEFGLDPTALLNEYNLEFKYFNV